MFEKKHIESHTEGIVPSHAKKLPPNVFTCTFRRYTRF